MSSWRWAASAASAALRVEFGRGGREQEPSTEAKVTVDLAGTSLSLPLVTGK
ncbi:hypothetical protein ABZ860_38500 [Microbispora sp. NPDC046973]|uniref:hypothetical protein n=1 Tax=Microbispora sp. NPDC046973 TaxID=3155022 RepID=UPI003400A083